jgi:hypothetical protein
LCLEEIEKQKTEATCEIPFRSSWASLITYQTEASRY